MKSLRHLMIGATDTQHQLGKNLPGTELFNIPKIVHYRIFANVIFAFKKRLHKVSEMTKIFGKTFAKM
jgi:hypothetical protein